jgi:hypothetical protein
VINMKELTIQKPEDQQVNAALIGSPNSEARQNLLVVPQQAFQDLQMVGMLQCWGVPTALSGTARKQR